MTQAKLITMDAGTLLTTPLPPTRFIISEMLPKGLHILAGAPKIGKSWLALMICLRVASGEARRKFRRALLCWPRYRIPRVAAGV